MDSISTFIIRIFYIDTNPFIRVWDKLQKSDVPPPKEDIEKWEREFNQLMNSQREDIYDLTSDMNNSWGMDYEDFDQYRNSITFDDEGIPNLGPYIFGEISLHHLGFIANFSLQRIKINT
jgi:hypothetical protein